MSYIELKDEILKKLRVVQIEILNEIVRICNENNIDYFLVGGTLLGSVRHKGYIPWDDDLDIAMLRRDYDKFLNICKTELSDNYYVDHYTTNDIYWLPFMKIRKKNTCFREQSIEHMNVNKGIYVDVFPIDNIQKDKGLILLLQVFMTRTITDTYLYKAKIRKSNELKRVFIVKIFSLFSYKKLHKIQDKFAKLYIKKDTKYLTSFCSPYYYKKEIFLKDQIIPFKQQKFENKVYNAPKNSDYYLSKMYGDYMKLPPLEDRVNHSVLGISFDDNNMMENIK